MATLIAPDHADPVADAEALRKACQGWGTDEKAIISIIGHRNAAQRKLIKEAYQQLYDEDLVKRFEKELSGDLEKAVYRWMLDPMDREAVMANVAIKKGDYRVIVELSCISSPEELLALRRAYQARYKHSLEEDVASHTTGDIRRLLVLLVSAYRFEGDATDPRLAETEADVLQHAVKDKAYNNDEIVRILTTRSKAQLVATFYRYRDVHGTSITKNLSADHENEFVSVLVTAIRCIKSPKKYLERVVKDAIHKSRTDEDALTRVIVTRAERDLEEIKDLYYKRNSVALEHALAKETSGPYEAFLLTLLGNEGH
ncbi:hypothetical protein Nepgr_006931 [Nepenthes gracilis]|uniref:Annexin n=1 Tax=Nepenthes gracilis TaxID=150966 RepID=A0AAD3S6G2_NEPGR|nr:hypothetical protein Nepgr_006931 [Nepenthes gracilis]